MKTTIPEAGFPQSDCRMSESLSASMLDGYLAAVASGPNLAMPDQVLRSLVASGFDIAPDMARKIVRQLVKINDELNSQTFVPELISVTEWCRGYRAGFADDMIAWTPLLAAQPGLMKAILAGAEDRPIDGGQEVFAEVARSIHEFWAGRRRSGADGELISAQLAYLMSRHGASPEHCH
jgi:hypothetical protein